jgi:hypothetical protein
MSSLGTPVTAKNRKEAREMRRKKRQNADDFVTKPDGKKDRLELAPGVESSEDITPLHNDVAAVAVAAALCKGVMSSLGTPVTAKNRKEAREMRRKKRQNADAAAAINQASASRRSPRYPSEQDEDDSCSVASSTRSARPAAVHIGGTESNHDEWTLQTQEVPDTEQGFETTLPIAAEAVVPNDTG